MQLKYLRCTIEKKLAKLVMYEKLAKAEKQLENGEDLLDAEEVFKGLRKKYGKG